MKALQRIRQLRAKRPRIHSLRRRTLKFQCCASHSQHKRRMIVGVFVCQVKRGFLKFSFRLLVVTSRLDPIETPTVSCPHNLCGKSLHAV